jgi:hypothetical protein
MIASMIGLMLTSILQTNAKSTVGKDCPIFQPCLDVGHLYKTSTCDPLHSKNVSWYNTCLCLNNINIGFCYNQCTSDPEAVAQGKAFQATITASCSAVNIDPKGPLPPAPWVNGGVVVTPTTRSTIGPTATSRLGTATKYITATTATKYSKGGHVFAENLNNAQKLVSSLAGLIVVLFA